MAAHARIGKTVVHCKRCGRHVDECGRLSWIGQCVDCSEARLLENMTGISTRTGVAFERWRSGQIRALQRL